MKREIDTSTIRVRGLNTPLLVIKRITRQKISKDTKELNNVTGQQDQIDIYITLQSMPEYTFFPSALGTL